MARERTGTVLFHRGRYFAVLTLDVENSDTTRREWIDLDTRDLKKAERLRDKLVIEANAGRLKARARGAVVRRETNAVLFPRYIESRRGGVSDAQLANWEHDHEARIEPVIGDFTPHETPKAMLCEVLERAKADLAIDAMAHLRQLIVSYFGDLEDREIITTNPARRLKLPKDVRGRDARPRALVRDDEFAQVLASERVDVETKIVALVARTIGGQRGAELNSLDWSGVNRDTFEDVRFIRAKTERATVLTIPDAVRPFLAMWHRSQGAPSVGPVFPITKGKRKGEAKGKATYALRWRRALVAAGVKRHELHHDTPTSRRTEFHSLRRAYSTALAGAGVNAQHAMHLSGHSDPKVHQNYVMATEAMRTVPIAALPPIPGIESLTRIVARRKRPKLSAERDTGFESVSALTNRIVRKVFSPDEDALPNDVRRDAHRVLAWLKQRALDVNDIALAKLVHRWEGDALGEARTIDGADVIDLSDVRNK